MYTGIEEFSSFMEEGRNQVSWEWKVTRKQREGGHRMMHALLDSTLMHLLSFLGFNFCCFIQFVPRRKSIVTGITDIILIGSEA